MKLTDLLSKIHLKTSEQIEVTSLCSDTRKIQKGALFVALSGTQTNGEKFIREAVQKGAVAVLTTHKDDSLSVPCFQVENPEKALAELCRYFYAPFPETAVAVTGTNGKTSTVFFARQLFEKLGQKAASIGTLGVQSAPFTRYSGMTTTGVVELAEDLQTLAQKDITHVAIEASSHGLHQERLSCLSFKAAAFTNLTRDHMDYHKTPEAYLKAKLKLFTERLSADGTAVLNADIPEFETIKKACEKRGVKILSYGTKGKDICLKSQTLFTTHQTLKLTVFGQNHTINFPVAGAFQGMNVLAALGLVIGCGFEPAQVVPLLSELHSPDGRMELVGQTKEGACIFVDYAHTPDGLLNALSSLRPITKGRLIVLFGCGGNRDTGKRPLMGKIAQQSADLVLITDDNPRFEDPALIRRAISEACPKGIEVADRALAIRQAVGMLQKEDVLLLAGKGHEEGQSIAGISHPFNDKHEVLKALYEKEKMPLWTSEEVSKALDINILKPFKAFGISIDSRTTQIGDLYINLTDNNTYNEKAFQRGAVAAISICRDENEPRQITLPDTQKAFEKLAEFARQRTKAVVIGITGSSGKTSTKEMLAEALKAYGSVHHTIANYNNWLGVPLTLTTLPKETDFAVIEMGMNHKGELAELSNLVKPDFSLITMIGWAHREFFKTLNQIALAKAEIFEGTTKGVFLNTECEELTLLEEKAAPLPITYFGTSEKADVRLLDLTETENKTHIKALCMGKEVDYSLDMIGTHFAINSLGVLAVLSRLEKDVSKGMARLSTLTPFKGRGKQTLISFKDMEILLVDDSYNANPSSMKAALAAFKKIKGKRHVAILGDMLELGEEGPQMHLDLKADLEGVDKVYTVGPLMRGLFETLPKNMQGSCVSEAKDILPLISLENGDILFVKGSLGSKVSQIVEELLKGKN